MVSSAGCSRGDSRYTQEVRTPTLYCTCVMSLILYLLKSWDWGKRDGSVITSTQCSRGGPMFSSHNPHDGSWPSVSQCWGTQWPPLTSVGTRSAHNTYPYMSAERSYTEEEIFKIEINVIQYRVKHFKPHNSLLFNTSQCWAATVFIEFQDVCTTGKEIWYPLSSHFPLSSSSSPTSLFSALLIYQFWVHHMNRIM